MAATAAGNSLTHHPLIKDRRFYHHRLLPTGLLRLGHLRPGGHALLPLARACPLCAHWSLGPAPPWPPVAANLGLDLFDDSVGGIIGAGGARRVRAWSSLCEQFVVFIQENEHYRCHILDARGHVRLALEQS
jgi:hypothetical protein